MKKRILCVFMAAFMLFAFAGCKNNQNQTEVIQPTNRNIKTPTMGIPLYFGYKNQPYLCAELREIPTSYEASMEQLAISELIKGPANSADLYPLIPSGTTATVSGVSDTLFITLSSEFLDTMPGENKNNSSAGQTSILDRRRLAVYSIVNTVTEIGGYSRVQILISDRQNPSGYRPKMYDVGFVPADNGKFLDTLPRSPEMILTPQNAASNLFSLMQEKQWESVFKCLDQSTSQAQAPMSAFDFESAAAKSNIIIESFSINQNVTYNQNGIALVNVNYTIRGNSASTEYTQVPIKLILTDNIWHIDVAAIMKILEKSS